MKPYLDEMVEIIFHLCRFDPTCMDETFTRKQIRTALESLTDEEYARIGKVVEVK